MVRRKIFWVAMVLCVNFGSWEGLSGKGNPGAQDKSKLRGAEFVLSPCAKKRKRLSASALKEQIGTMTKQTFEHATVTVQCLGKVQQVFSQIQNNILIQRPKKIFLKKIVDFGSAANRSLGFVQNDLAQLQKKCSGIIEGLINNSAPFKKSKKDVLDKTLNFLTTSQHRLHCCSKEIQDLHLRLTGVAEQKENIPFADIERMIRILDRQKKMVYEMNLMFGKDECLKQV